LVLAMQVSSRDASITKLKQQNHERPVEPSTRKRAIKVGTARNGPPPQGSFTVHPGDFAQLKMDLSWSRFSTFRVSIDRVDQGSVAMFDSVSKDSNGDLRIALNAGAFGPGDYMITIEGMNMRRES